MNERVEEAAHVAVIVGLAELVAVFLFCALLAVGAALRCGA